MTDTQQQSLGIRAVVQLQQRDPETGPVYLWRACGDQGHWLGPAQSGDLDALHADLPGKDLPVCLMVAGTEVVIQRVSFADEERRHLRRLIPFELEDQVTDELDDLHFALGWPEANQVATAYVDNAWLGQQIEELEALGLDVTHCIPEPLLLPRSDNAWTLRLDDNLQVHYGPALGFSVDRGLAAVTLEALCNSEPLPEEVLLLGADQDTISELHSMLPAAITEVLPAEQIVAQPLDRWDSLALTQDPGLDLRQGAYGRQIPFRRWWLEWRSVAILGMVALVAYIGVNVGEIQLLNSKRAALVEQTMAVYRQVVPQGQAPEPAAQLRTKIAAFEGESGGGSVIELYAKIAPLIADNDEVILRNLRYSSQSGDMQLTLDATSYGSVVALSEAINQAGLQARLQNTSQRGDQQQARMVVSRGAM